MEKLGVDGVKDTVEHNLGGYDIAAAGTTEEAARRLRECYS